MTDTTKKTVHKFEKKFSINPNPVTLGKDQKHICSLCNSTAKYVVDVHNNASFKCSNKECNKIWKAPKTLLFECKLFELFNGYTSKMRDYLKSVKQDYLIVETDNALNTVNDFIEAITFDDDLK